MPLFGYKECLCIYLYRVHLIHPAGSGESFLGKREILYEVVLLVKNIKRCNNMVTWERVKSFLLFVFINTFSEEFPDMD